MIKDITATKNETYKYIKSLKLLTQISFISCSVIFYIDFVDMV